MDQGPPTTYYNATNIFRHFQLKNHSSSNTFEGSQFEALHITCCNSTVRKAHVLSEYWPEHHTNPFSCIHLASARFGERTELGECRIACKVVPPVVENEGAQSLHTGSSNGWCSQQRSGHDDRCKSFTSSHLVTCLHDCGTCHCAWKGALR